MNELKNFRGQKVARYRKQLELGGKLDIPGKSIKTYLPYLCSNNNMPLLKNFMHFSDTDGFELTATDIQLDHPIEPGSIIAIKRPIKVSQPNSLGLCLNRCEL